MFSFLFKTFRHRSSIKSQWNLLDVCCSRSSQNRPRNKVLTIFTILFWYLRSLLMLSVQRFDEGISKMTHPSPWKLQIIKETERVREILYLSYILILSLIFKKSRVVWPIGPLMTVTQPNTRGISLPFEAYEIFSGTKEFAVIFKRFSLDQ